MAIDPTAVTTHDSNEIAPTPAMLAGSMMMPEPIMFTATMNVSCTTFIFFFVLAIPLLLNLSLRCSLTNHVGVELDATVHLLLVHALHFVVEAGETVERFFERRKIVEHGLGSRIPALAGNEHADARWIDECKRRGDAAADAGVERHVVHFVRHQRLVGVLRRHRELGKAAGAEAELLQFLDVRLAIEVVHLLANLAQRVSRITRTVLRKQGGQGLAERRIAIPEIFELHQLG